MKPSEYREQHTLITIRIPEPRAIQDMVAFAGDAVTEIEKLDTRVKMLEKEILTLRSVLRRG